MQETRIPALQTINLLFGPASPFPLLRASSSLTLRSNIGHLYEYFFVIPREDAVECILSHTTHEMQNLLRSLVKASDSKTFIPHEKLKASKQDGSCEPDAHEAYTSRELTECYLYDLSLLSFAISHDNVKLSNAQKDKIVRALAERDPMCDPAIKHFPLLLLGHLAALRHLTASPTYVSCFLFNSLAYVSNDITFFSLDSKQSVLGKCNEENHLHNNTIGTFCQTFNPNSVICHSVAGCHHLSTTPCTECRHI